MLSTVLEIQQKKKKKKTRSDGSGGYKSREEDSRKAKVISVKN